MSLVPFYRKAGVELVRYRPWEFDDFLSPRVVAKVKAMELNHWDEEAALGRCREDKKVRIEKKLKRLRKALPEKVKSLIHEFGFDPYVREVSSKPLKSWSKLKTFYQAVDAVLVEAGFLRCHDEICGAGGHIHISATAAEAAKVQKLMLNHPWAMYAFAHPSDDQHPLQNMTTRQLNRRRHRWESPFTVYTRAEAVERKANAIAYRSYGTVEFRMLDVAQSWEEQELHMAFAQAFVEYAIKNPTPEKLMMRDQVVRLTPKKCKAGFKNLIEVLGLPWEKYELYCEYIDARFKYKTSNF